METYSNLDHWEPILLQANTKFLASTQNTTYSISWEIATFGNAKKYSWPKAN